MRLLVILAVSVTLDTVQEGRAQRAAQLLKAQVALKAQVKRGGVFTEVEAAYHLASRKGDSKSVIVERFIVGNEHRLLVVGKRLVAAAPVGRAPIRRE